MQSMNWHRADLKNNNYKCSAREEKRRRIVFANTGAPALQPLFTYFVCFHGCFVHVRKCHDQQSHFEDGQICTRIRGTAARPLNITLFHDRLCETQTPEPSPRKPPDALCPHDVPSLVTPESSITHVDQKSPQAPRLTTRRHL